MKSFINKLFAVFLFLSLSLVIFYISIYLTIVLNAETDTSANSDAILVLGARVNINNKINPCLKARIDQSIDLYKNGKAGKIIFSGGNDIEDGVNEAESMKLQAIEQGISEEDILLEKSATSTYENFLYSQDILRENDLNSLIIVTEPFHMKRASLVADKLGMDYSVSPAKDSPCWTNNKYFSRYLLKEPVAILVYMLQGKL